MDSVTVRHPTNQTRIGRQRNNRVTLNTVVRRDEGEQEGERVKEERGREKRERE